HAQSGHQRKTLRPNPVNHAEVQSLRKITLLFRHLIERSVENLRRRDTMQIGTRVERLDETAIAGKLRENPQFNLRIVRDDQLSSFRIATETAPVLDRVRHLLNIRVRTCEAAGRRAYLPEIRMQTVRHRIDHLDHVFTVTRQRFLHGAIFEQRADDRILDGQRLKLPVARRIGNRNAKTSQRLSQLLLRIEINVLTLWTTEKRSLVRLLRQHFLQLLRKLDSSFFDDA